MAGMNEEETLKLFNSRAKLLKHMIERQHGVGDMRGGVIRMCAVMISTHAGGKFSAPFWLFGWMLREYWDAAAAWVKDAWDRLRGIDVEAEAAEADKLLRELYHRD